MQTIAPTFGASAIFSSSFHLFLLLAGLAHLAEFLVLTRNLKRIYGRVGVTKRRKMKTFGMISSGVFPS